MVWHVEARPGTVSCGRYGKVSCDELRFGLTRFGKAGMVWWHVFRRGVARQGGAW